MRLWHESLIPHLPRQQLLGQYRECCALRGRGWGRKHATVDYVFKYSPSLLVAYHFLVMDEMERRGYHPDKIWRNVNYRGTTLGFDDSFIEPQYKIAFTIFNDLNKIIYPEHNNNYFQECINNLKSKGIEINA